MTKEEKPKFVWQQEQVDALVAWMRAIEGNVERMQYRIKDLEIKTKIRKVCSMENLETVTPREKFRNSVKGIPTCHKCGQEHPTEPEKALTPDWDD